MSNTNLFALAHHSVEQILSHIDYAEEQVQAILILLQEIRADIQTCTDQRKVITAAIQRRKQGTNNNAPIISWVSAMAREKDRLNKELQEGWKDLNHMKKKLGQCIDIYNHLRTKLAIALIRSSES